MARAATIAEYTARERARAEAISHNRADRMRKHPIGAVPVPARLDKPQVIVTFDREGIFAGCVADIEDVPAGCTWLLEDMI